MESQQILSLEEQAAIERAREGIFKHAAVTYDLLPVGKSTVERISQFSARTRAPHEKKPATLKLQLCKFSVDLFDAEAEYYPKYAKDEAELRSWLQPVAARVGDEVGRDALDSSQDFHCSKADRLNAISYALNKRVNHWVGKKQSEIISMASGPQREEAAPSYIKGTFVSAVTTAPNVSDEVREPTHLKTIGEQIDRLRQESEDMTIEELAGEVNLDPTNVSRHIRNKSRPTPKHLREYQRVFSNRLKRKVFIRETQEDAAERS